jgi:hypothetical protein
MAATVVAAAGMRTMNLGPDTPIAALQHATIAHRPRLVWVSVSAPMETSVARAIGKWSASLPPTVTVVCGGRESEPLAAEGVRRLETMTDLHRLAASVSA